jgi:GTPase SAR1 family protein
MRALGEWKYDSLIKTYYKNISVFIFIYSIRDRKSFEMLDEALESLHEEVPKDKIKGILIGTKPGPDEKREVEYEEGVEFKKKSGLSVFLEASPDEISVKRVLKEFLQYSPTLLRGSPKE